MVSVTSSVFEFWNGTTAPKPGLRNGCTWFWNVVVSRCWSRKSLLTI